MDDQSEVIAVEKSQADTDLAIDLDNDSNGCNGNEDKSVEDEMQNAGKMITNSEDNNAEEIIEESDESKNDVTEDDTKEVAEEAGDESKNDIIEEDNEVVIKENDEQEQSDESGDKPEHEVIDCATSDTQEINDDSAEDKQRSESPDVQLIGESVRMSTDDDIQMEVIEVNEDDKQTNELTNEETDKEDKPFDKVSDFDLIVGGLKTSLMLSEEKNSKLEREKKEMEEELKNVYQHMFKCLEDKKILQIKCQTLEEQIEKMTSSGQKRSAQGSPSSAKPTPPKKAPQNNFGNRKSQFHKENDSRPSFGRFGARFRDNGHNAPPFPGVNATEFMPPTRGPPPMAEPMGGFRGPTLLPNPDLMDGTLTDGYQVISTIGNRLQLPASIVDRAVRLFRQCYDSPLRGMCRQQLEPMGTACLFIACRDEHCPQTFRTMCTVANVVHKQLDHCLSNIVSTLDICVEEQDDGPTPGQVISDFSQRAGFSRLIQAAAIQIVKSALRLNVLPQSQSADSAAAAALLLASMSSDEQRPVFELAYLTGVNDHHIRQVYNRLLPKARQLFPPNFPFVTPPERLPLM